MDGWGEQHFVSKFEHVLNCVLGECWGRLELCSHTSPPWSTLHDKPSSAAAVVWWILKGFVVLSPKASCVELPFRSVWAPCSGTHWLMPVWKVSKRNWPVKLNHDEAVQKSGVKISRDPGLAWLMIPMVNGSVTDLSVLGKCLHRGEIWSGSVWGRNLLLEERKKKKRWKGGTNWNVNFL